MPFIVYTCPECGQKFKMGAPKARQIVSCPYCRNRIIAVPPRPVKPPTTPQRMPYVQARPAPMPAPRPVEQPKSIYRVSRLPYMESKQTLAEKQALRRRIEKSKKHRSFLAISCGALGICLMLFINILLGIALLCVGVLVLQISFARKIMYMLAIVFIGMGTAMFLSLSGVLCGALLICLGILVLEQMAYIRRKRGR